jgi:ABC-2 type transport system ATP-binding protein
MNRAVPFIELVHLTKEYGPKCAVRDLTLTIPSGLIYCFLGPNGAGKTTTIKTIMGLKNPTRGDVLINGVSIRSRQIHEIRRSVGYLPDELMLYEHLTGREFLHFIGELYNVGPGLSDRVQVGLEKFDLSEDADTLIQKYSLGMKKKIALLATLIHDPNILIYDEPTGSLDALSARHVKDILLDYRNKGRLIFFTTHVMEIAERFADRLAIINEGSLFFDGSLDELRDRHSQKADETLEDIFIRIVGKGQPKASLSYSTGFPMTDS